MTELSQPFVIVNDTPCRKCGYNLRGLASDARCPECGVAVAASINSDLLQYSDPAWVMKLRQGTLLILAGVVAIIFGLVGVFAVLFETRGAAKLLSASCMFPGQILIFIGSWFLTEPDPSGLGEDKYGAARKIVRYTLMLRAVETVINTMTRAGGLPPQVARSLLVFAGMVGLVGLVGQYAQLYYYEKLAMRIPDPKLVNRAAMLKVWLTGCYVLVTVIGLIFIVVSPNPFAPRLPPGLQVVGCFAGILGILLGIFGLMYLSLIEKFNKHFKNLAKLAAANWAGHAGGQTQA